MDNRIDQVLHSIGKAFGGKIEKGARNYLEISIGKEAEKFGYTDLRDKYKDTFAIVPLKNPGKGMKVRIDGRTFVNYAEHISGIALPGHLVRQDGESFTAFVPNDSMICNFT